MTPANDELKRFDQWVAWQMEQREGKGTKVPYSPATGEPASTTNPTTWSDNESARTAAQRFGTRGGVGFVVSTKDPFCGIDLDHCIDDNGQVEPRARAIVDRFNSYTETTPSGR